MSKLAKVARLVPDLLAHPSVGRSIAAALEEDIGAGDVTTAATVDPDRTGSALLVSRERCVVAGLPLVQRIYAQLAAGGDGVTVSALVREGASVERGGRLARIEGSLATILVGERVALNFVQQLSGVATLTRRFVDAVSGTDAAILDTRKTTPGLRLLQKYAVRVGGGRNHRFGLHDGILVKDNHIAACGSIAEATKRIRATVPHGLKIEIECDTLEQVDEALAAGVDVILLDNMSPSLVRRSQRRIAGKALIEVSGGVTLENVRRYAESGASLISIGRLTHSAPAVDIGLDVIERRPGSKARR